MRWQAAAKALPLREARLLPHQRAKAKIVHPPTFTSRLRGRTKVVGRCEVKCHGFILWSARGRDLRSATGENRRLFTRCRRFDIIRLPGICTLREGSAQRAVGQGRAECASYPPSSNRGQQERVHASHRRQKGTPPTLVRAEAEGGGMSRGRHGRQAEAWNIACSSMPWQSVPCGMVAPLSPKHSGKDRVQIEITCGMAPTQSCCHEKGSHGRR